MRTCKLRVCLTPFILQEAQVLRGTHEETFHL
jgi:hypothetical protein